LFIPTFCLPYHGTDSITENMYILQLDQINALKVWEDIVIHLFVS
jgi:hypothetical protein